MQILKTFSLISVLFVFISCNKEGKPTNLESDSLKDQDNVTLRTSSTPEDYVSQQLPPIDSIQLEDIELESREVQVIVFNLISPTQRLNTWKERLETAKAHLTLSQISHIDQLDSFLTVSLFQDTLSSSANTFIFNWVNQAQNEYNFPETLVNKLLNTLTPLDQAVSFWNHDTAASDTGFPPDHGKPCVCSWDAFCSTFAGADYCINKGCTPKIVGCDWLMMGTCRGRCHDN